MPEPIATWSSAHDAWLTPAGPDMLPIFEHSDVYSGTWPTCGMTRSGTAYRLPMSEPRTDASACSSSRGTLPELPPGWEALPLLPTPGANLATSGVDLHRSARKGSGGDDLTTTVHRMTHPDHTERTTG